MYNYRVYNNLFWTFKFINIYIHAVLRFLFLFPWNIIPINDNIFCSNPNSTFRPFFTAGFSTTVIIINILSSPLQPLKTTKKNNGYVRIIIKTWSYNVDFNLKTIETLWNEKTNIIHYIYY